MVKLTFSTATEQLNIESICNNLALNRPKSAEIIFTNSRRRRNIQVPTPADGIQQVTSMKILGVTVSNVFPTLFVVVHRSCMHYAHCELMECVTLYSTSSTRLSSSPSWPTPPVPGATSYTSSSDRHSIWKRLFGEAFAVASVGMTYRP